MISIYSDRLDITHGECVGGWKAQITDFANHKFHIFNCKEMITTIVPYLDNLD